MNAARLLAYPAAPFPRLRVAIPLVEGSVCAGSPSPADDYKQRLIDLNELLVDNPPATFFIRASGESMIHAPINDGDLIVVDKSLTAQNGGIVVAIIDGEFTVKTLRKKGRVSGFSPRTQLFRTSSCTRSRTARCGASLSAACESFSGGKSVFVRGPGAGSLPWQLLRSVTATRFIVAVSGCSSRGCKRGRLWF